MALRSVRPEMRPAAPPVKNAPPGNLAAGRVAAGAPGPLPRGTGPGGREVTCRRFAATQALKRLTGLWKTPILLLLLEGPRRFADLERELRPISAKVLTQRLKELERDGFVARVEIVRAPPKVVEYRLTDRGEAARPIFDALVAWGRPAPP